MLEGEPEPVRRKQAQGRRSRAGAHRENGCADGADRPRAAAAQRLERTPEPQAEPPQLPRGRAQRSIQLTPKQRELLEVLRARRSVSEAAADAAREPVERLRQPAPHQPQAGHASVAELLALVRDGDLLDR